MIAISPPFLILGLAFFWLALWAVVNFGYWFIAATCLVAAGVFAWRVDAVARGILRERSEKANNIRPRDKDSLQM
jgi:membrane protein implicated in regulation of membrane protease activity